MARTETYTLKLTHAIVVDGEILRPGSLVDLAERDAKELLRRGKAVIAEEGDAPRNAVRQDSADEGEEGEADESEQAPPPPPEKAATNRKSGKGAGK